MNYFYARKLSKTLYKTFDLSTCCVVCHFNGSLTSFPSCFANSSHLFTYSLNNELVRWPLGWCWVDQGSQLHSTLLQVKISTPLRLPRPSILTRTQREWIKIVNWLWNKIISSRFKSQKNLKLSCSSTSTTRMATIKVPNGFVARRCEKLWVRRERKALGLAVVSGFWLA